MTQQVIIDKYAEFPEELKQTNQFVCWVGSDKIPKNPHTGGNAQSNNPDTWGTFEEATKACETYNFDGVGFMFAPPYFGVDLDHCIDNLDFVDEFVETLQSYAELSKSGNGIHIICKGSLPDGARRKGGVEMYQNGRYFICTGNIYNDKYRDVIDCTETIKVLHNKYLPQTTVQVIKQDDNPQHTLDDDELIDKARNCKSGQLFSVLYSGGWEGLFPSQSEADIAFCNQLAFWTACNKEQMDRIFRNSGLMRPKWDQLRGHDTYGNITLAKACASCVDVYDPDKYGDDTTLAVSFFKNGKVGSTKAGKAYDMTDTGNAHRLYDKYKGYIKYNYNRKKWMLWNGKQWLTDETGEIKRTADEVCEEMKKDAYTISDEKLQARTLKWAQRTANSAGKEAMIKECQHLDGVPANPEDFDKFDDLLNCQNGVVNLRNGELLPHDPAMMLSEICVTEYDETHQPPTQWLKFLDDVTNGDKALQRYLQKAVGYSVTGSNREQCIFFLYGLGNNGKSTFIDTIADVMGTYGANTQPDTLMIQSRLGSTGGGANSEIARLKSARFVTSEEPTEGVRLNEGLIKQITGGGKITCRFLYGDEFEYTPQFKMWVATNHKPIVRGTDVGIWRRIRLIPFETTIQKDKVDRNLKYKLRAEFPQILAWIIEGCILWQQEGLESPTCIAEATKEYKQEMDLIASFVDQCIEIDYNATEKIPATNIFSLYRSWAKENNEYEMSSKKFFTELTKKLPDKGRSGNGIYYTHIRFTPYTTTLTRSYSASSFK